MLNKEKLDLINIERTILEFGYSPSNLKDKSNKKIVVKCYKCNKERIVVFCDFNKAKSIFCLKCKEFERSLLKEPHEVSKYISIEKTIEKFKYDPRYLLKESEKKVVCICIKCNSINETTYATANKNTFLRCNKCAVSTIEYKNFRSKERKNYFSKNTHPWVGRKHSIENKKKIVLNRVTGYLKGKNSPNYGRVVSHGKGEWFIKEDETKIWMRSSWEIKYARYLSKNKINWTYEPKAFPITYLYEGSLKEGTYTPDFYLPESKEYIEVKGWWRDDSKNKFNTFKEQYPNEKIQLVMKDEMKQLGLI